MAKSGVEYLAQHPGWKTQKRGSKHPNTDLHRAGCTSCQMAHDKKLPDAWPGLRDKSPAIRAITRQVKQIREAREATSVKFNRTSHGYETQAEAGAYVDGIRFVNASSIEVVGIRRQGRIKGNDIARVGNYEVLLWDRDSVGDFKTYRVERKDLLVDFKVTQ